jgi:hypothetical protein
MHDDEWAAEDFNSIREKKREEKWKRKYQEFCFDNIK